MSPYISRRAFFRLALLAGIGGGLALFRKLTAPMNPVSFVRWKSRGLWLHHLGDPSVVALEECPTYQDDIVGVLRTMWDTAEMPAMQGKRILIKPNLVDEIDQYNVTTAPEVVCGAVDLLLELGAAEVWVGDGPAFRRDASAVAGKIGLLPGLNKRQVPFIDLNYDDPLPVKAQDGWFSNQTHIWLPRHAVNADYIISLAKMKTHHWAQVSLSLKNLLGILPGAKYGWPKNFIHFSGIPQTILGIHQVLPPVLSIIDGIIGMQGDGPLFGSPVEHGILLVGKDPVAVDMVGKDLMGFDTWSVDYLNLASWAGIGQAHQIVIRGADPVKHHREYQKPPTI
jgi:uncharacterized protein (DUF362 family)